LGEIEAAINQHHLVLQSVVIVHEDVQSNKRLVAYIVSEQPEKINPKELRNFLMQ
jgi:acyl-CoA synthetase (AMP-forming)/AMP-acid ligase II